MNFTTLKKMKEIGFNYIRLPFSEEFVKEGNWESMDLFFEHAEKLKIDGVGVFVDTNFNILVDIIKTINIFEITEKTLINLYIEKIEEGVLLEEAIYKFNLINSIFKGSLEQQ